MPPCYTSRIEAFNLTFFIIFNFICMNRKSLVLVGAAVVLLGGAGCSQTVMDTTTNSKPADSLASTTEQIVNGTTQPAAKPIDSITLSGKAIGNKMVQFKWTVPEGTKDPAAFHLVRGQHENPTQPPSYWFMQPGTSRNAIWVKLPLGEQHFRICTWEGDKCGVYSNDLMLDVK